MRRARAVAAAVALSVVPLAAWAQNRSETSGQRPTTSTTVPLATTVDLDCPAGCRTLRDDMRGPDGKPGY
ncbi:MAG: hypothetical protein LC798_16760 [Chloroflexi bacterium]|nr:hypothetical protein [Chloroflexota bacterium]